VAVLPAGGGGYEKKDKKKSKRYFKNHKEKIFEEKI
jgi:hypothetical protein